MKDVKVLRSSENKYVDASILPISDDHIQDFELGWKPLLRKEDFWDQELDLNTYLDKSENNHNKSEIYVLECNLITQGLIVLTPEINFSRLEPSKGLLYLNWLSVAPWNRVAMNNTPQYRGIGTTLFTFAIARSMNLGFEGRIGLHTVKQSEKFYEKLHLSDLGYDNFNSCRLKYLELPAEKAELILLNSLLTWSLN